MSNDFSAHASVSVPNGNGHGQQVCVCPPALTAAFQQPVEVRTIQPVIQQRFAEPIIQPIYQPVIERRFVEVAPEPPHNGCHNNGCFACAQRFVGRRFEECCRRW